MMKCLLCQTLNNPNSRFCSGCGAQFTGTAPIVRKNGLSTPVIIIIGVVLLCALCGMCGRSARDTDRSISAPLPTPANTNTYAPSTFASTDSANKTVNSNVASAPPVARKKKFPKKPPAPVNTPEPIADGKDTATDSDTDSVSGTNAPVYSAPAARSVAAPRSGGSGYYTGPRGGCYTYSASGKKRYVDRGLCN